MPNVTFDGTFHACSGPLQARFLRLLPRIERHGQITFRHLRCLDQKEEAIAEMVALCWKWFVRLARRGKAPERFPGALATFAARAVRSGRRACGQEPARDVLSAQAQRRHRFVVRSLPAKQSLGDPAL